jgi:hypothetical protein
MKRTTGLLATLSLLLAACESVTGVSPKDTPRVEIELAVVVERPFVEPLQDADDGLRELVHDAVLSEADMGLRFYPTPSSAYREGDTRPEYLMMIELAELRLDFDYETVKNDGEEPYVLTTIEELESSVNASIVRRRADGPDLVVARTSASAKVSAQSDPERIAASPGYRPRGESDEVKVLESDIRRSVATATAKALKAMRTPVDREFAPAEEPEPETASTE